MILNSKSYERVEDVVFMSVEFDKMCVLSDHQEIVEWFEKQNATVYAYEFPERDTMKIIFTHPFASGLTDMFEEFCEHF
jgi:hypothetical protein